MLETKNASWNVSIWHCYCTHGWQVRINASNDNAVQCSATSCLLGPCRHVDDPRNVRNLSVGDVQQHLSQQLLHAHHLHANTHRHVLSSKHRSCYLQTSSARNYWSQLKSASIGFGVCISNPSDSDADLSHNHSQLWLPYGIGQAIIFSSCGFFFLSSSSSPILSRCRLDVYHTSTHGVALMRI